MNKTIVLVAIATTGCGDYDTNAAASSDSGESSGSVITEAAAEWGPEPSTDESGGWEDDDGGGGGQDCAASEAAALAMLTTYCAGCHAPGTNAATDFENVSDLDALVADGRIVPGDSGASLLWLRIDSGQMPPPSASAFPSAAEADALREWIDGCAAVAPCEPGAPLETDWMLDVMRNDIADSSVVPADQRQFIRYFTLTHLYNEGLCGEELDVHRFALSKSINSLSNGTQVVAPVAIDANETIYRIDLRDYEWDQFLWEPIVTQSPYAIGFVQEEAVDLVQFAQTSVPMLRGDWFAAVATQPPLYHEILAVPGSRGELEALLGVDVDSNIANDEVMRAGFLDSGVSVNNRVIERHEIPAAASRSYWLSYDFASNAGEGNIFANPLDFVEAGNEMIYTLPNGLHGYMIVDGAGARLDEAPDDIVTDPAQPDQNVKNGLSCFRCHSGGMLDRSDELRAHVLASFDFDEATKEKVERLHPLPGELSAILGLDSQRYTDAIAQAGLPPDLVDDPINAVFVTYDGDVDLATAAAELGLEEMELFGQLGALGDDLQPLATGVIGREVFEAAFPQSVCDLGLGTTSACPF